LGENCRIGIRHSSSVPLCVIIIKKGILPRAESKNWNDLYSLMIKEHFALNYIFREAFVDLAHFCENINFSFKPTLVDKEDLLHLLECGPAELVLGLRAGAGRQFVIGTRRWADLLRLWQLNTKTTFDFKG
jgi:hypothetical protein